MKKFILGIIIGGVIFGSISGVVAYNYNAKNIEYTPSDSSWNVNNVNSALNDLKQNMFKLDAATTFTASDLKSGKTAYDNNGNLVVGTNENNSISYEIWGSGLFSNSSAGIVKTKTFSVAKNVQQVIIYVSISSAYGATPPSVSGTIVKSSSVQQKSSALTGGKFDSKFYEIIVNTTGNAGNITLNIAIGGSSTGNSADAIIIYKE